MTETHGRLSISEAEEMIDAFVVFDKNKDGQISIDELGPIMRAIGQNPSKAEIEKIMEKADTSGTGTLSKDEYIALIKNHIEDPNLVKAQLRDAFKFFDKEGNGYLEMEEMKKALGSLGEPMSDKEIKILMNLADTNNDGNVDIDEFVEVLCKRI